MAAKSPKRKRTDPSAQRTVRASISLDVSLYARLCAAAALRGVDRSTLAAGFIEVGLKNVVAYARNASPADGIPNDV